MCIQIFQVSVGKKIASRLKDKIMKILIMLRDFVLLMSLSQYVRINSKKSQEKMTDDDFFLL